jgi:NAD(P)-dependent dehydrogenase (short-subunit alcohol dehydrogenase family)
MTKRFSGKTAVITGAAMGIGKAAAQQLGEEGARLALLDIDEGVLKMTISEFKEKGIEAKSYITNVSSEKNVQETISAIENEWKNIDILVHAAGIVGPTSTKITDYPSDEFDKIYGVNLKGTFLISKYVLQVMEKKGIGRIVLIASIAGKEGNPGMVGYSSTKAGVIGLVKGIAKEYATTGILINGLAPAVIQTPMNDGTSPEQLKYMLAKIPMQRIGKVEEVAAMICFIVSDENSFSTGFIFDISGGRATY